MTVSTTKPRRWAAFALIVGFVAICGSVLAQDPPATGPTIARPPRSPPPLPQEILTAIERTATAARKLSTTALPNRATLGADWKVPWELPPELLERAASEQAYWEQAGRQMMPAGLSAADAAKFIDAVTGLGSGVGRAPAGMGQKEVLVMLLSRLRAEDNPPAERIASDLALSRQLFALAPPAEAPSSPGGDPEARRRARAAAAAAAQQTMMEAVLAPYKDLSAAQVKEALGKHLSLMTERTEMIYYRCNNWQALLHPTTVPTQPTAGAGTPDRPPVRQTLADRGIWVGKMKVKVLILDPNRPGEMKDLVRSEVAALQAKLSATAQAAVEAGTKFRQQHVDARIAAKLKEADEASRAQPAVDAGPPPGRSNVPTSQMSPEAYAAELERVARTFIQPTSKPSTQPGDTAEDRAAARRAKALKDIDQIKADWDAERQALSKLAVTIESKQFGDNCYVIRFTGVTPDQLGAQSALNCGWLRKGNVCISVEASGNFPEQAMADAMNLFLKEIDAKFVSSDDLR